MGALLSIGVSAMYANQAALQTVGQNIANANTPGYSRQSVVLTTPDGQFTGSGYFGKGVTVQSVERSHNEFLTKQAASTKSLATMDSTRMTQLAQLEKIFPTGDSGLGAAASQFLNAMVDVASRPADSSARQVVLGRASELAARFSSAGQQVAQLQSGVVSDLKASVTTVNQLSLQIAQANEQIAKSNGNGQTPNDLLDKRDQLISKLSEYVQVTTLPASDGTLGVFIGGGQRLVLGTQAQALSITPDRYDSNRAVLSISESTGTRALDESVLNGGSMTALLRYQNTDLQDARNMLGQMAAAMSSRVNEQQALGLDLSNPAGSGAPMFAVGEARGLPAVSNSRKSDGTFVASVTVKIVDAEAKQLQASAYKLRPIGDPAASTYELTRLSDNLTRTVKDGDTVDGFTFTFGATPPNTGDTFVIEPVGQAAVGMRRALDQPNGIAAAAPLSASTGVKNTGTATVDSLYAVNKQLDMTKAPLTIAFGDTDPLDSSKRLYQITLADGSTLDGSWAAGKPIGNQPNSTPPIDLGLELQLNGVPAKGDTITLDPTKFSSANNGNAKAFLNMSLERFVGEQVNADGSITPGTTINDAYSSTMSEIGSRVQGATYLSSVSVAVAADAETSRSGQAGVNIDEEASRLMQFQQGYQAAAKVLQSAQTIFDELMRIVSR